VETLKEQDEAAADMFLNWVYRRIEQGPSPSHAVICDQSAIPSYTGPGFSNLSWLNGLQTPEAQTRPGDTRYQWMDITMITLFNEQEVTAQAEKRSVIKGEMTVGGKWVDIRRANLHVNERLTSA